tara:strand:- start:843 stop:1145 length:303 start_codon:yes stop_codon:yes gene_type:complete
MELKVIKNTNPKSTKRFTAIFSENGKKVKTTHFGLKNPKKGTYIDHKDKEIRKNYRARHKKDLKTGDYTRAGHLSYYILWGDKTDLQDAIKDYKKRFKLK